ncbi:MAG TPA: extracellular matrix/biofilm biosynthesis regulator RemA family protein [Thermodesulfobacteriota bacterium]
MKTQILNLGFGNAVVAARVVVIVNPNSAPMRRLKEHARDLGKLIDASQGRRTRALVVTDSDHVILSGIQPDTLAQRLATGAGEE